MLFSLTISLGEKGVLHGSILFALLIAARLINGMFGSATRPSSGAWVADITDAEDRSRAFARLDSWVFNGQNTWSGFSRVFTSNFLYRSLLSFCFYGFHCNDSNNKRKSL